jgi:hypothetical protein
MLVAVVVDRKSAVMWSSLLLVRNPYTTKNPEKTPTRLMTTCTKVSAVIPRIMGCLPGIRAYYVSVTEIARKVYGSRRLGITITS